MVLPSKQIPLPLKLQDSATFETFHGAGNSTLVATLQAEQEPFVFFWGGCSSGKSHLLQAICRNAGSRGVYLPLPMVMEFTLDIFEGLEDMDVVALDDLHGVAGNQAWETALFHLYNRVRAAGHRLIAAANGTPPGLGFVLPDLVSRLMWGPIFQLKALGDEEKKQVLCKRARMRGFDMPDDVAAYLLKHTARDMHSLFELLGRLDSASLAEQRRLTVPFIRRLL